MTDFDFDHFVALLEFAECLGGTGADCHGGFLLYSGSSPAFASIEEGAGGDDPHGGHDGELHSLEAGTAVWLEIVQLDARLQVQVAQSLLRQAGDTAVLGTVPFHAHPVWQLIVPSGTEVHDQIFTLTFRLRADGSAYEPSPAYTLQLRVVESGGNGQPHEDDDHAH